MVKTRKKKYTYTIHDYNSGEGMLTSVWGPSLWFFLHTVSFNYPANPSEAQKKHYKEFILMLKNILPCRYCRENLQKNLKSLPLRQKDLKNRHTFSLWVYKLHEKVNKMLGKKSGLKYCDVRERFEHFRSRCTTAKIKNNTSLRKLIKKSRKCKKGRKKEKGCVEPLNGKKIKMCY